MLVQISYTHQASALVLVFERSDSVFLPATLVSLASFTSGKVFVAAF